MGQWWTIQIEETGAFIHKGGPGDDGLEWIDVSFVNNVYDSYSKYRYSIVK